MTIDPQRVHNALMFAHAFIGNRTEVGDPRRIHMDVISQYALEAFEADEPEPSEAVAKAVATLRHVIDCHEDDFGREAPEARAALDLLAKATLAANASEKVV